MSKELDIKVDVLGFHPKHGELISAKAAKEVIEGIQEQMANAIDEYKTLFDAFEYCQDELKKANERADKAERAEKIATLAAQDMNLEKSIALEKVQKLEKTLGNCADGLAKANERVKELENSFKQSIPIVDTLYDLARHQLWIAYVWNDHNFPLNPEKYAKVAAESIGITNLDEANKLIEAFKQLRKEQANG